jgi:putative pyruvate formate lyase activating enzyme
MLQQNGVENINIVTGTHFLPSLAEGIREAKRKGLTKPVIWNSSGYEKLEYFSVLDDFVDIYLPDLKTLESSLSGVMFGAPDYPRAAAAAVKNMAASRPLRYKDSSCGGQQVLVSGVIVRHLVLPGLRENTRAVLAWFADNVADKALLSLMFQYTPPAGRALPQQGEWRRTISSEEYENTIAMLDEFGIEEGFIQEPPENTGACLPDFSLWNAFPGGLAHPLWFYGKKETRETPALDSRRADFA